MPKSRNAISKRKSGSKEDVTEKKEELISPEEFLLVLQEDYKDMLAGIPDDDPAIFVRWTTKARVHQVCAIAGSPVVQGGTAHVSMGNMRAYFRAAVGPGRIVSLWILIRC
jgi:hypothetical protein